MATGFERLRAGLVIGAVGSALVPGLAHVADAHTSGIAIHGSEGHDTITFGGPFGATFNRLALWQFRNDVQWPTNTTVHAYGVGSLLRHTSYRCFGPCPSTTQSSSDSEIFRGLDLVEINGVPFVNPDGTVDQTSSTITSDAHRVSRIRTQIRHDFFGMDDKGNAITRILVTMTNPSRHVLTRTIDIGTHLGQDTDTAVYNSSDGDQNWEASDAWDQLYEFNDIPSIILVRGDNPISTIKNDPVGNGNAVDEYTLKFKPHQTRRLLLYAVVGPIAPPGAGRPGSVAHHFDNGLSLSTNGLLAGLSTNERKQVANWTGLS